MINTYRKCPLDGHGATGAVDAELRTRSDDYFRQGAGPQIFAHAPKTDFSLTKMFDAANEQERLFGLRLDGVWMHVGTPDAVNAAEEAFLESVA